jgi:uncharacterized protein YgiM (DUF1202 family)
MRAIMTEDSVRVYSEAKEGAISIFSLRKGDEVETGKVTRKKKESWVEVTLDSGQKGFISGQTRIFVVRKIELMTETQMFDTASESAELVKTLPKGTVVSAVGVEKEGSNTWYLVREENGDQGYVNGRSKYKVYQEATLGGGKKLIITGGVFAVMGLVFLVVSMSQQSTSSSLFLIIGLIGLGLVQVVQGVLQYRKAKNKQGAK